MDKQYLLALNRIRQFREEQNISQKAIAQALGSHDTVYSRMEGGKIEITLPQLFIIATALKKKIEEILEISPNSLQQNNNVGITVQSGSGSINISVPIEEFKQLLATSEQNKLEVKRK
ncbi:MAG: helix-turn-helix transcriptional regulator [Bacteroidetes bacterium]|nr:helix-turn-helix transcriptional regulator [Bacteroidota bacterium]MBS1739191.1 helix-turn-helix transcriptional regulator [Bacteroidota bacterium]